MAFLRQKYGLSFTAALVHLGVTPTAIPKKARPLERWLVMDFTIDGMAHEAAVRDEPESMLQVYRRIHAEALDRLSELCNGDLEQCDDEAEIQWSILASSWELMRLEGGHGEV